VIQQEQFVADKKAKKKARTARSPGVADRAAAVAHETVDEFRERAVKAERQLVRRAEAGGRSIVDRAGGILQKVTSYVEENPFTSVSLAFGVGILATVMLRASGVDLMRLLAPPEDDIAN
jgi:ElaB/YqjD/DUF883 family membrane-anchored ribosome-binding protein